MIYKNKLKAIFASLLLIGVIFGCNKPPLDVQKTNNQTDSEIISRINNFQPDKDDYAKVYRNFVTEKKLAMDNSRSSAADERIDTARWNMETYLNSEYGFRIDTGYFNNTIIDTVLLTIDSYDDGIPVVDGDELVSYLADKEDLVSTENSDEDSLYFWSATIAVGGIVSGQVQIITSVNLHINYNGVYPPGWDPDNFPSYTCMKAWTLAEHDCGGDTWFGGANKQYIKKYRCGASMSANYIMVYVNTWYKSATSSGVNGRLFHKTEPCANYILETSNGDELNDFLQSTKNLIDDCNPNGAFNHYLGNCYIAYHQQNIIWPYDYGHMLVYSIFEKVYIGNPN